MSYRGRLAPSPSGYLHLGHARTFWTAAERARGADGELILRIEDLDRTRCREPFAAALLEDLRWIGLHWNEGPDVGGSCEPYEQSRRSKLYVEAFEKLRRLGHIYPCFCSRQEVAQAVSAPHIGEEEPIYSGRCRDRREKTSTSLWRAGANWRFRTTPGRRVSFEDYHLGPQAAVCGVDFGDFLVWRKDDVPSYQLAVTVDDAAMAIGEVVRGADLITSTFRQLLLYEALQLSPPAFYHCELVVDEHGQRLAKRTDAVSLRALREQGLSPAEVRSKWQNANLRAPGSGNALEYQKSG